MRPAEFSFEAPIKGESSNDLVYRLLLAFGSNLGDREQNLNDALKYISSWSKIICTSSWQKTLPLQNPLYNTADHDYYLNFVVDVATQLKPCDFYSLVIVEIEDRLGHSREAKWMPRALDIDVVFAAQNNSAHFKDCTPVRLRENNFFVPHLEYFKRDFWRKMIEGDLNYVPKG
jgi:2-amino-4-hydroxy-6-hydroxymethyldihydropteridine diphosphokinase